MFSSVIIPLAMATTALASVLPHGLVSSDAEWCQGLGGGAFDTASNFTLAAYEITGVHTNDTGSRLVLTEASTDGSNVWMSFATFASDPDNTFTMFNLNAGVLTPNPGNTGANVTDLDVTSGQALEFQASTDGDNDHLPDPVQVYCAIASTDPYGGNPYPVLAVNKDSDSFSLCTSTAGPSKGQNIIIYEASETSTDYDYDSCVAVRVQLIGLE